MGMIGGGKDAFIGAVHRAAANLDGLIELSCAALSADPKKAMESGKMLFLDANRVYPSYKHLFENESTEKIDFVSIVTPNFAHFEPAMMALERGLHVVIDKPMTFTLAEAKKLAAKAREKNLIVCVTYTYSGYPMVKQAREMVRQGRFGKIRKIMVRYTQGWLSEPVDNKQANWRTDPDKSGKSGCMGDIGTHAAHLAEYISGTEIAEICADLHTVVPGRNLDDDGNILLRFKNGANGVLIASQIAAGEENNLSVAIYGEKGGAEWNQQEPNTLTVKWGTAATETIRTGGSNLCSAAIHNTRTPAGHPEGYIEAFANIYRNFALTIAARIDGTPPTNEMLDFPDAYDGLRGMAFIENVIASSQSEKKWWPFID